MKTTPRITGIGVAFVDVISNVTDDFILAHSLSKSATTIVDTHKIGYLLESLDSPLIIPGGSTANLLCGLSVYGLPSTFIGRTGDDTYGAIFRNAFVPYDVSFENDRLKDRTTSTCLTLVTPDHERSFVISSHAAGYALKPQDLPVLPDSHDIYICVEANMALSPAGCHLDESVLAATLINYGQSKRHLIIGLNDRDILKTALPLLQQALSFGNTMIMGNINEFLALFQEHDLAVAFEKAQKTGRDFIITNGEDGIYLVTPDMIDHVPATPVSEEKIINTVGAGDQFAAGFIAAMVHGQSYRQAAAQGAAAAGLIIQQPGARPAAPLNATKDIIKET